MKDLNLVIDHLLTHVRVYKKILIDKKRRAKISPIAEIEALCTEAKIHALKFLREELIKALAYMPEEEKPSDRLDYKDFGDNQEKK